MKYAQRWGNYINKHLRFKMKFLKTKSKHLLSETSCVFLNAISQSFNQLFPVNIH